MKKALWVRQLRRTMIGRIQLALGMLILSGCATAPFGFVSMAPTTDLSLTCATNKLTEMGYILKPNATANLVRAKKQTSSLGKEILFQQRTWTELVVSQAYQPNADPRLQVVVWQYSEGIALQASNPSPAEPTKHGITDAKAILTACGRGEIKQVSCKSRNIWDPDMSTC